MWQTGILLPFISVMVVVGSNYNGPGSSTGPTILGGGGK